VNVLFSSSRQWNPGDELFLMGLLNVMRSAGLSFNPVLYNRHPVLMRRRGWNGLDEVFDNSYMSGTSDALDYLVLAGSPEWTGRNLRVFAGHDKRASTVDRFATSEVRPEEFLERLGTLNLEWASRKAVENRMEAEERYAGHIRRMAEAWREHGVCKED